MAETVTPSTTQALFDHYDTGRIHKAEYRNFAAILAKFNSFKLAYDWIFRIYDGL